MTDTGPGPAPARRWHPVAIRAIERAAARIVTVTLERPAGFDFLPGQHVDVRLTAPDGYQAWRSYSLASPPSDREGLGLMIALLPDGEVSGYFHDGAQPGDTVEIRGPIGGHFVWDPADGPALLVGAGSGLAPLMSMVRSRARQRSGVPLALIQSDRDHHHLCFGPELSALAQADPAFLYRPTLTRAAAPLPPGFRSGRVDGRLLHGIRQDLHALGADAVRAYVCGPNAFVGTVADLLVADGVKPEAIRTERFGA